MDNEIVHFPMEITKERAQNLRIKMRNAELSLKGARVIHGLQQDCLFKVASKSERLNCFLWSESTPSTEENIRAFN